MIRQPNVQGQITIPKEYLKKLGIKKGDYFDVKLKNEIIVLQPVTVEPKFTERELDKIERLFLSSDNQGEIFNSGSEAMESLKRRMKKL